MIFKQYNLKRVVAMILLFNLIMLPNQDLNVRADVEKEPPKVTNYDKTVTPISGVENGYTVKLDISGNTFTTTSETKKSADLILCIDVSSSMDEKYDNQQTKWAKLKETLNDVIDKVLSNHLKSYYTVTIIAYAGGGTNKEDYSVLVEKSNDKDTVKNSYTGYNTATALAKENNIATSNGAGTDSKAGFIGALKCLRSWKAKNILADNEYVIYLSDGVPTYYSEYSYKEVEESTRLTKDVVIDGNDYVEIDWSSSPAKATFDNEEYLKACEEQENSYKSKNIKYEKTEEEKTGSEYYWWKSVEYQYKVATYFIYGTYKTVKDTDDTYNADNNPYEPFPYEQEDLKVERHDNDGGNTTQEEISNAIEAAKRLRKEFSSPKTKLYTVGICMSDDSEVLVGDDSKNYKPDAYYPAKNSSDLEKAFEALIESITKEAYLYNMKVTDQLSQYVDIIDATQIKLLHGTDEVLMTPEKEENIINYYIINGDNTKTKVMSYDTNTKLIKCDLSKVKTEATKGDTFQLAYDITLNDNAKCQEEYVAGQNGCVNGQKVENLVVKEDTSQVGYPTNAYATFEYTTEPDNDSPETYYFPVPVAKPICPTTSLVIEKKLSEMSMTPDLNYIFNIEISGKPYKGAYKVTTGGSSDTYECEDGQVTIPADAKITIDRLKPWQTYKVEEVLPTGNESKDYAVSQVDQSKKEETASKQTILGSETEENDFIKEGKAVNVNLTFTNEALGKIKVNKSLDKQDTTGNNSFIFALTGYVGQAYKDYKDNKEVKPNFTAYLSLDADSTGNVNGEFTNLPKGYYIVKEISHINYEPTSKPEIAEYKTSGSVDFVNTDKTVKEYFDDTDIVTNHAEFKNGVVTFK